MLWPTVFFNIYFICHYLYVHGSMYICARDGDGARQKRLEGAPRDLGDVSAEN